MSNKNFKPLAKRLATYGIAFKGYPHRRHRTKVKVARNNKKLMLGKIINNEHRQMMDDAT